MNAQPLVSIIMPSYNSEEFIEDSIKSVLDQTYHNWELIIIDDCSTDKTKSIINSINNKKIKIIENEKNLGAAKSRNKGIEIAQGRFIAFLDSDDLWEKEKLDIQTSFMLKNNLHFTYTNYQQIDAQGNFVKKLKSPKKLSYSELLKTCYIGCLTAVYDTQYFGKVFMPEIKKRQDFALWLALLKKTSYAYGIDECLASYRIHEQSLSSSKIKTAKYNWEIYRKVEGLGFFKSIYYFSNYAFIGAYRKYLKKP